MSPTRTYDLATPAAAGVAALRHLRLDARHNQLDISDVLTFLRAVGLVGLRVRRLVEHAAACCVNPHMFLAVSSQKPLPAFTKRRLHHSNPLTLSATEPHARRGGDQAQGPQAAPGAAVDLGPAGARLVRAAGWFTA